MENGETLEKLYKKVIEIDIKLDNYFSRHERLENDMKEKNYDYEKRIRFLERIVWLGMGMIILLEVGWRLLSK